MCVCGGRGGGGGEYECLCVRLCVVLCCVCGVSIGIRSCDYFGVGI